MDYFRPRAPLMEFPLMRVSDRPVTTVVKAGGSQTRPYISEIELAVPQKMAGPSFSYAPKLPFVSNSGSGRDGLLIGLTLVVAGPAG